MVHSVLPTLQIQVLHEKLEVLCFYFYGGDKDGKIQTQIQRPNFSLDIGSLVVGEA